MNNARRRLIIVALAAVLAIAPAVSAQGRLDRVREAVDKPDPPPKPKDADKSDSSSCDSSPLSSDDSSSTSTSSGSGCGSSGDSFYPGLALAFALAPFALPHWALNDDFAREGYFPDYPYAGQHCGYLKLNAVEDDQHKQLSSVAGRFSVEEGNDFRGLNRVGGRAYIETTSRFGLQSRLDWFSERLDCGCRDDLLMGSTEVTFRFAQRERVQVYTGIGPRYLCDRRRTFWGFNFTYGADFYPVKPLVLSFSLDAGTLGDASVFQLRGSAGWTWKQFELFGGYDYRRIDSVDLQGPMLGLRLWF